MRCGFASVGTNGGFELHSLLDGFFGLDGGAMFGVVPKPVWERTNPADSRNRIRLASRPLLIVTPTERILVDTGIGDRWDAKARDIYNIERPDTIESSLARAGFRPEDVTKVVLTHLHFDHAGATTKLDDSGKPVPRFPNARHYVQRKEWEAAIAPNRRSRTSYRPDDFLPVQDAGLLELIDGDWKLDLAARDTIRNVGHFGHVPSLELVLTGGHTPGHQIVMVKDNSEIRNQKPESRIAEPGGRTASSGHSVPRSLDPSVPVRAVFWGDLIPTSSHIATPYIMGYDLSPLETMEQKEKLVPQAIAGKWLSFLEHDPEYACGVIEEENGKPFLRPLAE
jgi:glyoxylase-like metal-dependent hydrolase (beta-lactamase superfamily II)